MNKILPVSVNPRARRAARLSAETDVRAFIPRGVQIRTPVRYGDDIWNVEGYPLVNQSVKSIEFAEIPVRWRFVVVKDWIHPPSQPTLARTGASGLDTAARTPSPLPLPAPISMMTAITYALSFKVTLPIIDAHGTV